MHRGMTGHTADGPVLGIESSCDETACAVLAADGTVLAEAVLSQTDHAAYGGVVPEIAARAHLAHLPDLAAGVMRHAAGVEYGRAGRRWRPAAGPGLIGGLIVGAELCQGHRPRPRHRCRSSRSTTWRRMR